MPANDMPLSYGCAVPGCGWRMIVQTAFAGDYEIRTHLNDSHDIGDLHALYVAALCDADNARGELAEAWDAGYEGGRSEIAARTAGIWNDDILNPFRVAAADELVRLGQEIGDENGD